MGARSDADAEERGGEDVCVWGERRDQQDRAEPDLERADVLDEVLVVRRERSEDIEERHWRRHGPQSAADENDPGGDRDDARLSVDST